MNSFEGVNHRFQNFKKMTIQEAIEYGKEDPGKQIEINSYAEHVLAAIQTHPRFLPFQYFKPVEYQWIFGNTTTSDDVQASEGVSEIFSPLERIQEIYDYIFKQCQHFEKRELSLLDPQLSLDRFHEIYQLERSLHLKQFCKQIKQEIARNDCLSTQEKVLEWIGKCPSKKDLMDLVKWFSTIDMLRLSKKDARMLFSVLLNSSAVANYWEIIQILVKDVRFSDAKGKSFSFSWRIANELQHREWIEEFGFCTGIESIGTPRE